MWVRIYYYHYVDTKCINSIFIITCYLIIIIQDQFTCYFSSLVDNVAPVCVACYATLTPTALSWQSDLRSAIQKFPWKCVDETYSVQRLWIEVWVCTYVCKRLCGRAYMFLCAYKRAGSAHLWKDQLNTLHTKSVKFDWVRFTYWRCYHNFVYQAYQATAMTQAHCEESGKCSRFQCIIITSTQQSQISPTTLRGVT